MSNPISFAATTPRFGLPNLFPGQAQKEFFVNEALGLLDGLIHLVVEGQQATPPTAPAVNECWFVDENPTGEWSGKSGEIAIFGQGGWAFVSPSNGMLAYDRQLSRFRRFDGSWLQAATPSEPSGGTTIDAEARVAIGEILSALTSLGIISST